MRYYGDMEILTYVRAGILMIHLVGAAVGLGAATISDIFFFKFLKDFRISRWEAGMLRTLSWVIWAALAIIVISGAALYMPEAERLNQSPKFLVKMIAVVVLIINGICLNLFIAPKLTAISFGKRHRHEAGELHRLRKTAFALGAISLTSWYSAFFLGLMHENPLAFVPLLAIYLALLCGSIIISQIVGHTIYKRSL